jgi:hypothetical protein
VRGRTKLVAVLALGVALAACEGPGPWTKDGVSPKHAAADFSECRMEAQHDIGRDVNIDTDIAAGRQRDWDRSQTSQIHHASDASVNDERSDDIVRACMESKGYAPNGPAPSSRGHLLGFLGL